MLVDFVECIKEGFDTVWSAIEVSLDRSAHNIGYLTWFILFEPLLEESCADVLNQAVKVTKAEKVWMIVIRSLLPSLDEVVVCY